VRSISSSLPDTASLHSIPGVSVAEFKPVAESSGLRRPAEGRSVPADWICEAGRGYFRRLTPGVRVLSLLMRGGCVVGARGLGIAVASFGAAGLEAAGAVEEFTVHCEGGALVVSVQSPPADRLAAEPLLLLFFSADRMSSLPDGRYGAPGRLFIEQGHRVASFDLPAHGERVDRHGSGISGLAARVAAGEKPFDLFVAEGRAVIDACIRRGLAGEGRVVVAGVSRGGYCALRLAAADTRVAAVAALAPATDWAEVTEFTAWKHDPAVMALALPRFADQLAGRRIYVAIGNHDLRTGTDACTRFVLAVAEAERRQGLNRSGMRYLIVDDSPGHGLAARWREEGMRFLMGAPLPSPPASAP